MFTRIRVASFVAAVVATGLLGESPAQAAVAYVRSQVGSPWGTVTNEQAMDLAFSTGGWDDLRYETVNPTVLFSDAYTIVYMEGSDSNATELEAFLLANRTLLETWVADGGFAFVNAAPNEDDGMVVGFGGVAIHFDPNLGSTFSINPGAPVEPTHPIWQGPFLPAPLTFSGSSFAHATVSGPRLVPLIVDADGGEPHLGELAFGDGLVLVGGLTTSNWWSPQPDVLNLRANMLGYLVGLGDDDDDGFNNLTDNCSIVSNPDQEDFDTDGDGDVCDGCPLDFDNDADLDLVCGEIDNCPDTPNVEQLDADGDLLGDACDFCPLDPANDADFDGVCESTDNCPNAPNADQADEDGDGIGDACEQDVGEDGTSGGTTDDPGDGSGSSESAASDDESSSGSSSGSRSSSTSGSTTGDPEASTSEAGSGSGSGEAVPIDGAEDTGCGCRSRDAKPSLLLILLAGLVVGRRRRAASSR